MLHLLYKFLATPLLALITGEENLFIGFEPLHCRNASAIAEPNPKLVQRFLVGDAL